MKYLRCITLCYNSPQNPTSFSDGPGIASSEEPRIPESRTLNPINPEPRTINPKPQALKTLNPKPCNFKNSLDNCTKRR